METETHNALLKGESDHSSPNRLESVGLSLGRREGAVDAATDIMSPQSASLAIKVGISVARNTVHDT
jgi:hypothetical protein